jgi:hypothetical protein
MAAFGRSVPATASRKMIIMKNYAQLTGTWGCYDLLFCPLAHGTPWILSWYSMRVPVEYHAISIIGSVKIDGLCYFQGTVEVL